MLSTTDKLIAAIALIVWLVLTWIASVMLGLKSPDVWIFRGGLALLGIIGVAGFLYLRSRSGGRPAAPKGAAKGPIGQVFREAGAKLQRSRKGTLESMPAFVMLGEAGSSKTTTIVRSGLEPELLAGHAFEENVVTPTREVNIWFARDTLFIDPSGGLLDDPQRRAALIANAAPARLGSVFGRKQQAPRAAVVCVDCGLFAAGGGSQAVEQKAAQLRDQLGDICNRLGISLPVYVLFTKFDRIAHFAEFVRNLSREEAADVFGVGLPIQATADGGIYAHDASQRVHTAMHDLFGRLVTRRPEVLGREHEGATLASIYEFPREFSKFRGLVSQFLVELCKPSQLRANPFLRGFYFTGVRAVVVSEAAAAPARVRAAEAPGFGSEATRLFHMPAGTPTPEPVSPVARKVPEWVYLPRIFPEILLRDTSALKASTASTKVALWQRLLLGSAAALALIYVIGATVSFFNNRALVARGTQAAEAASAAQVGADGVSLDGLRQLDALRASLAEIRGYRRDGVPMSLRWGLYSGEDAYPHLHRSYFGAFRRALLAGSHESILETLTRATADSGADPRHVYSSLKAYLITTSHPQKSELPFLADVLRGHWAGTRKPDNERSELAWKQFAFYGDVLLEGNPLPSLSRPDDAAVDRGRDYLARFAATDAIYMAMLGEAAQRRPPIKLSDLYPGSGDVIASTYTVPAAFGKPGWDFMQKAMRAPDRYFSGERWVLGDRAIAALDRVKLEQDLKTRYYADFLKHWREFVRSTSVLRYASIPDAATKLSKLSSNQSPLLGAMCIVSENTAVDVPEVASVFQPAQQVTPAGCRERLGSPGNQPYMDNLIKLQASLQQVAATPGPQGEMFRMQAGSDATNAQVATRQVAQNFRIDQEGQMHAMVGKLLEDPIKHVQAVLQGAPKGELNGKAKQFCAQVRSLTSKYPFNPKAQQEASLAEVGALLAPGSGALWQFYETDLKALLTRQGNDFMPNPAAPMKLNPAFVSFMSRMASASDLFFRGGSKEPKFDFTIRLVPTEGVESAQLTMLGQRMQGRGPQKFAWPGSAQDVRLAAKFAGGSDINYPPPPPGLWSVFRFFEDAERWEPAGAEWIVQKSLFDSRGQPVTVGGGRPATVRLAVDTPVFRPGSLAFACVADAAR
jgi:type VI secretion system protein ImpL